MNHTPLDPSLRDAVTRRLDSVESMLPGLEKQLLRLQRGTLEIRTKTTGVDLVTQADTTSERILVEHLNEHFPDDAIIGEEGTDQGNHEDADVSFKWILDPIDGTTNFANRFPIWAISIGLRHGDTTVGGLVRAPGLHLRYRAVRGEGATCNGEPIRINDKTSLREGIVATGFPYDRAKRAAPLSRALENILRKAGGVRRLGAAALDLCFLADGRLTGYYEMGLQPWDFAAGVLIAEEAGAMLTDFEGGPLDIFKSAGVVAANPKLHPELLETVHPMREATAIV
ncbi:MAG: inositol monophosphatase family protein [Opitutales bacterium]